MMMRITTAKDKPMMRALSRCCGLTLFAKIATNTKLSMPNTTSKTNRVKNPTKVAGSNTQLKSMRLFQFNKRKKRPVFTGRLLTLEGQQDEGLSRRIMTRTIFIHSVAASTKILMGISLTVCKGGVQVFPNPCATHKVP